MPWYWPVFALSPNQYRGTLSPEYFASSTGVVTMDLYFSPQGNDDDNGTGPATAKKTVSAANKFLADSAKPGDRLLFRADGQFPGTLEIGCRFPLHVGTYDGNVRATILSGASNGLNYSGTGGLFVRGLKLVGDGQSTDPLHTGFNVGAEAAGLDFEDVEASGYTFANMLLMGDLRDVTVRKAYLHHSANGLFVSAPTVRGLRVLNSEIAHNGVPHNPQSSGFGLSINGTEEIEVAGNHIHHNSGTGGGSGCMVYLCRHFDIHHNRVEDNNDPNPDTGDGQGIVADDSWEGWIGSNDIRCNLNGGIQLHDELQGSSPSDITIRGNYIEGCVIGLSHQGGAGNVLWEGNEVICVTRAAYMAAIDVYRAEVGTRFRRNILRAEGGALLLMMDQGLGGATFDLDDWRSQTPVFVSRGRGFTSLAALLAAEPLGIQQAGKKSKPKGKLAKLLPGQPARSTTRGERIREMLANVRKHAGKGVV